MIVKVGGFDCLLWFIALTTKPIVLQSRQDFVSYNDDHNDLLADLGYGSQS